MECFIARERRVKAEWVERERDGGTFAAIRSEPADWIDGEVSTGLSSCEDVI